MKKIGPEVIRELVKQSVESPRLRSHYNIHDSLDEDIQRLLICLQPNSFIRPHFHPEEDKKEMLILLQGSCTAITFDNEGNISEKVKLSHENGTLVSEFPPKAYHSIICHDADTVIMEVKKGPYKPLPAECFADWAPDEKDPHRIEYIDRLREQISN